MRRFSVKRPIALAWSVILLIDLLAVIGLFQLRYDDGLQGAFSGSSPSFRAYEQFSAQFTQSDGDIAVLFRAPDFADPDALTRVADFVLEAQLLDGVSDAVSLFSLGGPIASDGSVSALLPSILPAQPQLARLLDSLRADATGGVRLISADRDLTAVIVTLADGGFDLAAARSTMAGIDALASTVLAGSGVTHFVTGLPVLRIVVIDNLFGDLLMLNLVGAITGLLVCAFALRSLPLSLLATMPSSTALIWALAALAYLGFEINVVSVALPVLILVLSFADSLHLTFEVRRLHADGVPDADIPLQALSRVGGACALASLTTAFAFGGLLLSDSVLIRDLGMAGIIAALVSLAAVLLVHPLLFATAFRFFAAERLFNGVRGTPPPVFDWRILARLGQRRPLFVAALSALIMVMASIAYSTIKPSYSFSENIDPDHPVAVTLEALDRELAPAVAIDIPVRLPRNIAEGLDTTTLQHLDIVQEIVSDFGPGDPVLSLAAFPVAASADRATSLTAMLGEMSDTQYRRFISADGDYALVRWLTRDAGSATNRNTIRALEAALMSDSRLEPGSVEPPTGFLAMASQVSGDMILDLNLSFLFAVGASGLFITLWFRNLRFGLIALIPNVLPIVIVGAWLALSGRGLQFSSGVALTIAFGIAVDDTVHILNRQRLNTTPDRRFDMAALRRSLAEVTPVLVVTTAVLSIGMVGTLFAAEPMVSFFGILSIAVFCLAILADLVVLPAWMVLVARWGKLRRTD